MGAKRRAKVRVTRVQGINKNTYVGDSIVSEDMFPIGNFDLLVGNGYLEEIKDKKAEVKDEEKAEVKKSKKAENKEG
jgi:hypothetical protein